MADGLPCPLWTCRKPAGRQSKAPSAEPPAAPSQEAAPKAPARQREPYGGSRREENRSGNRRGKVYGRAPKAQPKTIGDRRREDAARKAARQAADSDSRQPYRSAKGYQPNSERAAEPRQEKKTFGGRAAYTKKNAPHRTSSENAPRKQEGRETRPHSPPAKKEKRR